ncbi:FtsX-like permease family protein [Desulfitobacterium sp. PCE1]|uniref:ABC transporter permease n=1 Tax=Desulfitobacterium sp. PCE1 TaxID=146907 RepID=UPI000365ECAC|nr:FtsX-like permease family protein [Desulfitobacterium sp. PCE1]
MTLNHIALENLRRRPGKTLFLILTFAFIVSTISALTILALVMKEDLQKSLTEYGANVVISPRSEHLNLSYGGLSVSGVEYEVKKLDADAVEMISQEMGSEVTIAPKVIGSAEAMGKTFMIIGVDFDQELKIKPWWKIEGRVAEDNQVVIGSQLAMNSNLKIGDILDLGKGKYPVVGIMEETGGAEDQGVFTTINTARSLTDITSEWSLIELNTQDTAQTVTQLTSVLRSANVTEVTQLVQGSKESLERFASFSSTISLAMGLIGALVIIVTLAGNVHDRARELGVLRAIGFRQRHILSLLGREVLITSLTGSLLGYIIGVFVPLVLGPLLGYSNFAFAPYVGLGSALIAGSLLVGVLAMIYPAWRILKLNLQDVLKFI